jgi:hypothetical protein
MVRACFQNEDTIQKKAFNVKVRQGGYKWLGKMSHKWKKGYTNCRSSFGRQTYVWRFWPYAIYKAVDMLKEEHGRFYGRLR